MQQMIAGIVRRMLDPIAQRVRLMVSRAVIKIVDDSLKCQGLQVSLLADEVRDDVERFQEYGFTSVPEAGAEAVFVSVGGNRAHGIVVATEDRRYRIKDLDPGDVCLYTREGERVFLDDSADLVHLGAKAATDFVALAAATKSEINALRTTVNSLVTTFNAHTHPYVDTPIGAAVTAPTATSASAPAAVGDVKATKVKAT
jgi:phage baseplate assembly protein V